MSNGTRSNSRHKACFLGIARSIRLGVSLDWTEFELKILIRLTEADRIDANLALLDVDAGWSSSGTACLAREAKFVRAVVIAARAFADGFAIVY